MSDFDYLKELDSRVNTVFVVRQDVVVKLPGRRFRRGMRLYSPGRLLRHEHRCLELLSDLDIAPKPLFFNGHILAMSHCGRRMDEVGAPFDWELQASRIATSLAERRIMHLDLKPSNILSDGKTLRLVDFGWSLIGGKGYVNPSLKNARLKNLNCSELIERETLETLRRVISSVL